MKILLVAILAMAVVSNVSALGGNRIYIMIILIVVIILILLLLLECYCQYIFIQVKLFTVNGSHTIAFDVLKYLFMHESNILIVKLS